MPEALRHSLAAVAVLVLLTGCGEREPRRLPAPVFDPRAVLPPLAGPRVPGSEGASPAAPQPRSAFDRALAGAGAAADDRDQTGPEPSPGLTVPLGGRVVATLPADGSWSWSNDRGATLALHRGDDRRIDGLLYAEPFSPLVRVQPSREAARFRWTVLPPGGFLLPARGETAVSPVGGLSEIAAVSRQLVAATRTAGRGLGFIPFEEGATGTRWVGENGQALMIRLARYAGNWGAQHRLPDDPPAEDWEPLPAYLLLGSVTAGPADGAHLAILCTRDPGCSAAADIAIFLGSLRPESSGAIERLRSEAVLPLTELAGQARLRLEARE